MFRGNAMQKFNHPLSKSAQTSGAFTKNEPAPISERTKNVLRNLIMRRLGREIPPLSSVMDIQNALRILENGEGSWNMWARILPSARLCGKKSLNELKEFAVENGLAERFFLLGTPSLVALQKLGVTSLSDFRSFVSGDLAWRQRAMTKFSPISKNIVPSITEMEALAGSLEIEDGEITPRQWGFVKSAIVEGFTPGLTELKWLIESNPEWKAAIIAHGAGKEDVRRIEALAAKAGFMVKG
jgi:hypothetical protein